MSRLNALFDIVVPAVVDTGGHVNKFLGDGALAVFGAPNELADHADAAVKAAVLIDRLVAERFGGDLRIGIGINTGLVIAGTIGGAGKLEFTLIGDTVNVAARVEQLTKTTGDTILLTQQTVDAMATRPTGSSTGRSHELKGKSAACADIRPQRGQLICLDDGWQRPSLAAWTAFGSGHGIGTGRGTHGCCTRSASSFCCRSIFFGAFVVVAYRGVWSLRQGGRRHRCRHAIAGVCVDPSRLERKCRLVEQWAADRDVDRAKAMDATYVWRGASWSERSWAARCGIALLDVGVVV